MMNTENNFTPTDLFHYAEMLLKEYSLREANVQLCANNYGWLTSRQVQNDVFKIDEELEKLRPMIQKITSENCAKIAFKLDSLTDEAGTATAILSTFKSLLEEQYSMQLMERNVNKVKERRFKKNKMNRVHPVLIPDGRQPTVSFILDI